MNLDLSPLHTQYLDSIEIDDCYHIDHSYYQNSDIIRLSPIKVKGTITERENENGLFEDYMECVIQGKMILLDSISLDEIEYPFSIDFSDFLEKNNYLHENILDIFEFLWENILLEVPLYYSEVEDYNQFHGDGWRLIHENEINSYNPFRDLLKDVEKE